MKTANPFFGLAMLLWLPLAAGQEAGTRQEKAQEQEQEQKLEQEQEQEQRTEMRREIGEAVDAIRTYSIERRKDALDAAQRAMEDADQKAARLQARLDARRERMDAAARQRSQEAMADLRRQRAGLTDRAADLQHASRDAWGEARHDFVDGYHAFLEAADRMRARLDRDPAGEPAADTEEEEER